MTRPRGQDFRSVGGVDPGIEARRPEIAFASERGQRKRSRWAPYHFTNPEQPWETACGLPLDGSTVKPLGVGDWTCQHRACAKANRSYFQEQPQ